MRVFKRLRIPDVIGQPTMAEACGEWFLAIVEAIFGSLDVEANRRMVQEFFLLVPKKNAKSSLGGAVMLEALILNRRPGGEFLLVAPTKEIADISFKQAAGTIRADPELAKLFHIQRHIRQITHRLTDATLQIKAADTDVITGSKAVGTLIDETHVFAKRPRAADVFLELRGALAARPDGFLINITTQSKEPPAGVFRQELAQARAVRDGRTFLPLLPVLYELPSETAADGGWKRRGTWGMVNPNLGRSVDEGFLAREVGKVEGDPAAEALLASQHFNVEIGLSLVTDRWAGADEWEGAVDKTLTLEDLISRSECVTAGIDGGGLDDLFALAFIGRETGTGRWLLWIRAWCYRKVLDLRKGVASRLLDFERGGDLKIIDRLGEDIVECVDLIRKVEDTGKLASVGLDPFGVGAVVDALDEAGISGPQRVVGVSQGFKLMGAIKTAERKLADGTLVHADQPLMAWAVGNAKVEPKGNAILITKQAAGVAKIDPLMAAFNAIALMSMNPEAQGSVYTAERGLAVFG